MKIRASSRAIILTIALLASVPYPILGDAPANPSAPATAEPSDTTVVGTIEIDGKVIKKVTAGDVKSKLAVLPPQLSGAPYNQIFPLLLKSVVTEQVITYYADKDNTEATPEYAKMVEECKKGAKQKLFLDKEIAKRATDDELKKAYEEVKKAAPKEDEYNISMITVTDKQKASDLLRQAKKAGPSKFSELANKESMNKIPDGNLGFVRLGELPEAFRDKVKNTPQATIVPTVVEIAMPDPAEPNKKMTSYNIILVQEKRPAKFPEFEAVKNELKGAVSGKFAKEVIKDLEGKAKIELFGLDGKPLDQSPPKADSSPVAPATIPAA